MNKKQFIDKMLVKYMSNANVQQAQLVAEEYENHLNSQLDFDYLYDKIVSEYSQRSIPLVSQLKQWFRIAKEFEQHATNGTWKIFAETKSGVPYEFHCWLSTPEIIGVKEFKECRPELIYLGNNYREVMKYGY